MTAKETERLAKVEQKLDDLKESTDQGIKALNDKMDSFIRHANDSFITKAQAQAVGWVIGVFLTLVGLWLMFKGK